MCIEAREWGCHNCPYYIDSCEYCVLSQEYVDSPIFPAKKEEDYGTYEDNRE